MARSVKKAANQVNAAANQHNNAAKWASIVMDKVFREGITITGLGIPIGVKLGAPSDDDIGPIVKQLRKIIGAWKKDKP